MSLSGDDKAVADRGVVLRAGREHVITLLAHRTVLRNCLNDSSLFPEVELCIFVYNFMFMSYLLAFLQHTVCVVRTVCTVCILMSDSLSSKLLLLASL
jgi:hypothetical protein